MFPTDNHSISSCYLLPSKTLSSKREGEVFFWGLKVFVSETDAYGHKHDIYDYISYQASTGCQIPNIKHIPMYMHVDPSKEQDPALWPR